MGASRFEAARTYRDEVAAFLRDEGLPSVRQRPHMKMSAAFEGDPRPGDFEGLPPNTAIAASAQQKLDFSGLLVTAKREAARAGAEFAFGVNRRGGSRCGSLDIGDSFVVCDLATLAGLLRVLKDRS
jgi:hypothetical protein